MYAIKTPKRKRIVKRAVRCASIAPSVVNSPSTATEILSAVSHKILTEMKNLNSLPNDSILRNTYTIEALKYFDWERVLIELRTNIPTLINLLNYIVPRPAKNIPLICLIASQLLKSRNLQLGLVQRAQSVILYSHGASKQVITNDMHYKAH